MRTPCKILNWAIKHSFISKACKGLEAVERDNTAFREDDWQPTRLLPWITCIDKNVQRKVDSSSNLFIFSEYGGLKILFRVHALVDCVFSPGWLDIGGWKASSLCTGPERNTEQRSWTLQNKNYTEVWQDCLWIRLKLLTVVCWMWHRRVVL